MPYAVDCDNQEKKGGLDMINNVVIAGKVVELPKLKETSNGTKYATMLLEVTRPFRNSNGQYDSDHILITLWKGVAEMANDVCKIGDTIGVKARIQTFNVEKDTQTYYNYEFIAEQISFLSA